MVFVGQRPVDVLAGWVEPPEFVVACEGGGDAETVARRLGCRVETVEDRIGVRRVWSNATIGEAAALLPSGCGAIGAYAASPALEEVARRCDERLLTIPHELKDRLDDKHFVRSALRSIGTPVVESRLFTRARMSYDVLCRGIGLPFVVQRIRGSAGVGTWIVRERDDLDAVRAGAADPLLVSRYVDGVVLNVHGVVTSGDVHVTAPSVQAAGVAGVAAAPAGYCGNDFGRAADVEPEVRARVQRATATIGGWLRRSGYRGVFGADFVVDGKVPYALEINPRFQGSSWLLGELERAAGRTPVGALHAATWDERAAVVSEHDPPLEGSFLVLHHVGAGPLDAPGFLDVDVAEVDVSGLAAPGVQIEPGAVLARLSSRRSLLADSATLTDLGRRAVAVVSRALAGATLTPA